MVLNPKALAIAAGGTGGHIMPAIAAARAVSNIDPSVEIRFICGQREIELQIYKAAGIEPVVLPVGRFGKGLMGKIDTAWQIWRARGVAARFLKEFRPFCLLGMGGYVTFPQVWAAHQLKIPLVLHEANAMLGRAHRFTQKWAHVIACSYPETVKSLRKTPGVLVGTPVRADIADADPAAARRHFKIGDGERVLLVTGGSQGARGVNELVRGSLNILSGWANTAGRGLVLLWACGTQEYEGIRAEVARWSSAPFTVRLFPFIERMDLAYAAADLVVCRAGAMSVAEVAVSGRAAIFVPLPTAMEGHQQRNAEAAVGRGAALMALEGATEPSEFGRVITDLLSDEERLRQMSEASARGARKDAAERLAKLLLSLAQPKSLSSTEYNSTPSGHTS